MPYSRFFPTFNIGRAPRGLLARNLGLELRRQEEIFQATQRWKAERQAIIDKWRELKGPASAVGLPLDPLFPLVSLPEGSKVDFRGGSLRVRNHNPGVVDVEMRHVVVTFEGYGLEIRQERGDELYGTLHCKIGSTGYAQSFDIPQVELGPEDDNRVWQTSMVFWDGPPADINIVAHLSEHDEGDREEVRQQVRGRVRQMFEAGRKVAFPAQAGAETAAVLNSLAAESESGNGLLDWTLNAVGDLVDDVLGLGDDIYNPAALTITAAEMSQIPPLRVYKCWNDSRTIPFTHSRTITCRDDAGDVGQVTMLFLVRSK